MVDIRSNMDEIADHSPRYVEELRDFLKTSGVLFGSPEHLADLTKRLREDNGFREEMYYMVRSIIFREGGAMPPAKLLRLLAAAAGGAAVDEQAEQHRPEIRYLLQFLTGVTRAPVNQPRAAVPQPAPSPDAREANTVAFSSAVPQTATPLSGKPSARTLKWNEFWNQFAVAGTRRLSASRRRSWWLAGSGAALALLSLLLWRSHAKAPTPAIQRSAAPVIAAHPPQIASQRKFSPPEETQTSLAPTPGANDSLPRRSDVPVTLRKHSDVNAPSQAPVASTRKTSALPLKPKERLAGHPVPSAGAAPARPAATQARTEARSSAASSVVSERTDPGLRRGERSPADAPHASPSNRGALDVSSGVMSANLISAPAPEYPRLASAIHLQGTVILQAVIGKNGEVTATYVLSGHHLLRDAAVRAVRQWRYRPFLAEGHPVDVATVVTVDFRRRH